MLKWKRIWTPDAAFSLSFSLSLWWSNGLRKKKIYTSQRFIWFSDYFLFCCETNLNFIAIARTVNSIYSTPNSIIVFVCCWGIWNASINTMNIKHIKRSWHIHKLNSIRRLWRCSMLWEFMLCRLFNLRKVFLPYRNQYEFW